MTKPIPDIVVGRLPIYLRALTFLAAEGTQVTSSHDLGKRPGINAAQPTSAHWANQAARCVPRRQRREAA